MRPDRHSRAWLALDWAEGLRAPLRQEAVALVYDWQRRNLPLVVASSRPGDATDSLRLGLTTPDRQRIGLNVAAGAVHRLLPPPRLEEIAHAAPEGWQAALHNLLGMARAEAVELRAYGSLAWQAASGCDYLRPGSDLDLLIGPDAPAAFLIALMTLPDSPRLDGELALPGQRATSWREAAARPAHLLVKGHGGPWLLPRHEVWP